MTTKFDVIVVGGGPAGSVAAWALAQHAVKVLLLDRARFPREKVCGDYIEPRGLRILANLRCLTEIERDSPLPISHAATYVNSHCRYRDKIPFYGLRKDLPPHGYIIPREKLDYVLLQSAIKAGATVHQETDVTSVSVSTRGVTVAARRGDRSVTYRSSLLVGADGVNSIVARCMGILANDTRHIALSQRAYAEGVEDDLGEAAFFFERDLFPGYGWMFPMAGGQVNFGVGILSETCKRLNISVPHLFTEFFERLKRVHGRCANLRLCRPTIGGIVKTYGGAGPNHFNRGVLIGDAGSFVDPMTGEGITPAMESALIAVPILLKALATGRFDTEFLSQYERDFRGYFDPSMIFLDLCAASMRNHHFSDSWLTGLERGCQLAQKYRTYARIVGACFGGLDIDPPGVLAQLWIGMAWEWLNLGPRSVQAALTKQPFPLAAWMRDIVGGQIGWWCSVMDDPLWHISWMLDLERKWLHAFSIMSQAKKDPRVRGLL